jgi:hypothetical protein
MKRNILIIAAFCVFLCACSATETSDIRTRPTEELIVFMDKGTRPAPDDIDVKRVRFLLDYLAESTSTPRAKIGDYTEAAVTTIEEKYGKKITRQEFLEGARRLVTSASSSKEKEDYKSIASLLIIEASAK